VTTLGDLVRDELATPVPAGAHALAERLRATYGDTLRAVLMYGSNLRQGDDREGVIDLYAFVSDYRAAYRRRALVAANRLLPPNVFYLEATIGTRLVRCKYAVLELRQLPRFTSPATAEPYFWARFAQPCALVWSADEAARATVVDALANAVRTFVRFGVPLVASPFDARTLWASAWRATYGAEIRPERPGAVDALWARHADRFERATALAVPALPWAARTIVTDGTVQFDVDVPAAERQRAARAWRRERRWAKSRFLLRMLRNGLIFEGGVDYVLWKIERHSGVSIDHAWRERRHPMLALGAEAWRLYRAGAFR
jgi:hypothetical protein